MNELLLDADELFRRSRGGTRGGAMSGDSDLRRIRDDLFSIVRQGGTLKEVVDALKEYL